MAGCDGARMLLTFMLSVVAGDDVVAGCSREATALGRADVQTCRRPEAACGDGADEDREGVRGAVAE